MKAIRLIQKGIPPEKMKGSWAGAMGNFQFMPSTYLEYGVDYDNDGYIDLWNSLPDALASAANYLSSEGWNPKLPWGREVFLPKKFDWTLIERKKQSPNGKKKASALPEKSKNPKRRLPNCFCLPAYRGLLFGLFKLSRHYEVE